MYLSLWPMTRRERLRQGRAGLWSELLGHPPRIVPSGSMGTYAPTWSATVAAYQLVPLPAYPVNRARRLIKTPKAYWYDTGLALRLAGAT